MTCRLPASNWISRTVSPSGSAPVHSALCQWCNPRFSPSFFCSLVTQNRGVRLDDDVPKLSNRNACAKATARIAPATGQLTHSRR
jgi:hypothetical protein